jgi:hypothetical protein
VSTILKALQRLEDEKSAKRGRSLEQRIVAQRAPVERSRRGVWLGCAALAGLALGAPALWLWRGETRSEADGASEAHDAAVPRAPEAALAAAQSSHDAERVASARSAARERAAERAKRRRSARSGDEAVAPVRAEAAEEIPLVEVVKRLDPQPADSPSSAQLSALDPLELEARVASAFEASAPPAASAPRSADTTARAEATARAERDAAAEAAAFRSSAAQTASTQPALSAEPAVRAIAASGPHSAPGAAPPASAAGAARGEQVVARAALPELSVARTVWHPDAERRLAIVRSTESGEEVRLRIGDAYGPLVVEAIHPSSVLFDHDGVEIQYGVGR